MSEMTDQETDAPRSFWTFPDPYVQVLVLLPLLGAFGGYLAFAKGALSREAAGGSLFGGLLVFWFVVYTLTRLSRPWRYRVDDKQMRADRFWIPRRVSIPWNDISQVQKVETTSLRYLFGAWPEIAIQGRDGTVILVTALLPRYVELVEVIRRRALNCAAFEVHAPWGFVGQR